MPALRERKDDLLALARHFLSRFAEEEGKAFRGLASDAEELFLSYDWPGNVRELQNVIQNVVVLHNGERIAVEMLPPPLNDSLPSRKVGSVAARAAETEFASPEASASLKPLWLVEKEAIERAIEHCGGNIPRAAALLEVSPSTIYRKRQLWASDEG